MRKGICYAERHAIMERIRERCSTSRSERAEAAGACNDYCAVYAYPYAPGLHAEFTWETARRLSLVGGKFNLG